MDRYLHPHETQTQIQVGHPLLGHLIALEGGGRRNHLVEFVSAWSLPWRTGFLRSDVGGELFQDRFSGQHADPEGAAIRHAIVAQVYIAALGLLELCVFQTPVGVECAAQLVFFRNCVSGEDTRHESRLLRQVATDFRNERILRKSQMSGKPWQYLGQARHLLADVSKSATTMRRGLRGLDLGPVRILPAR